MNRSVLAVPVVAVAAVAALVVGSGHGSTAAAEDPPTSNSGNSGIVVDGLGKVTGSPDVLRATLGVTVRRDTVNSALDEANALQNKLRAALKRDGVAPDDLQTSDVSISPSYSNKGVPNGYAVSETVTVKLRDLKKAGQAISDAVTASGNAATLQGVSFSLEDNAALLDKARDAAYADAKQKADRYAGLTGQGLGKVLLVSESTSAPQPVPYALDSAAAAKPASSPVPIDPGTSQVSVSVTVRWALS